MTKKKEINETDTVETVEIKESAEKTKLRAYFEAYKLKNPVKYEQKKESFEKQLASMQ